MVRDELSMSLIFWSYGRDELSVLDFLEGYLLLHPNITFFLSRSWNGLRSLGKVGNNLRTYKTLPMKLFNFYRSWEVPCLGYPCFG